MYTIKRVSVSNNVAVRLSKSDDEYRVETIEKGRVLHGWTYFTDDKKDAIETLDLVVAKEKEVARKFQANVVAAL